MQTELLDSQILYTAVLIKPEHLLESKELMKLTMPLYLHRNKALYKSRITYFEAWGFCRYSTRPRLHVTIDWLSSKYTSCHSGSIRVMLSAFLSQAARPYRRLFRQSVARDDSVGSFYPLDAGIVLVFPIKS